MRFNLSAKITSLIATLLMGLGLMMLATFGFLSSRQIDRTIAADGLTAGKQVALYLSERSEDLEHHVSFAAMGEPRVRALVFSEDPPTISAEIPRLCKEFSVDAVEILSPDGVPMGKSPGLEGLSERARSLVGDVLRTSTQKTAVVRDGSSIMLVSCAPVVGAGYLKGAIAFFKRLGETDARKLSSNSGYALGFVAEGRLVASSLPTTYSPPPADGHPKELNIVGQQYVSIAQRLPNSDPSDRVAFVVLRPTSAIVAPYEEAKSAFVTGLLLALVVSLFCGVMFGRGLVKPIESLVAAVQVVQKGEWPATFAVVRDDEIGILQGSFNEMVVASKSAQEKLLAMIDLDPLTELCNHRRFRERLSQEARRSEANGESLALALVDIDGFDKFNDDEGHSHGDALLRLLSDTIRERIPEFAVAARYAGDQFTILLPASDSADVAGLGRALSASLKLQGCPLTISIGCSEFPKNSVKEDGLMLAAELALARAKQLGRDQVCSFDAVPGADQSADPFLLYQSVENGSFATIQALAAAVDAKDAYTNGHSERVAKYSSELSAVLGDSPEMVDRIFRCGTLHDVGKIGVPDAILKKPGRLEPDEQRVMETHPVLGEMIAGKVPQLADLLPGVRHHHEKWDGTGYPDQLSGEAIPYIARVLAIADTYDAMTSDRPYRKGLAVDIALGEIEKHAGTQFDPMIAAAFVRMMRPERNIAAA